MSGVFRSAAYRVAKGVRCRFRYESNAPRLECEWEPDMPRNLNLSSRVRLKILRAYRVARDEFLGEVSAQTAGNILLIEASEREAADLQLALAVPGGNA